MGITPEEAWEAFADRVTDAIGEIQEGIEALGEDIESSRG